MVFPLVIPINILDLGERKRNSSNGTRLSILCDLFYIWAINLRSIYLRRNPRVLCIIEVTKCKGRSGDAGHYNHSP